MITTEKVSIVIPAHDECDAIPLLHAEIVEAMREVSPDWEVIWVDDFSTDATPEVLREIVRVDPHVVSVRLRRNQGQTAALAAGFDFATGDIIVSMDGDLQHDPAEIPQLVRALVESGCDIANGWRKDRDDDFLRRRFPSMVANRLMARLSGLQLRDFGSTFKAYRSRVLRSVRLYGELHRFIPALAVVEGVSAVEVPIHCRTRRFGRSHYGLGRTVRVLFDLLTVRFLISYLTRPAHFFGVPGLACGLTGIALGLYLVVSKLLGGVSIVEAHGPLMELTALLIATGFQLVCFGLIGEVLTRIYFESSGRSIYSLGRVLRHGDLVEESSGAPSLPVGAAS